MFDWQRTKKDKSEFQICVVNVHNVLARMSKYACTTLVNIFGVEVRNLFYLHMFKIYAIVQFPVSVNMRRNITTPPIQTENDEHPAVCVKWNQKNELCLLYVYNTENVATLQIYPNNVLLMDQISGNTKNQSRTRKKASNETRPFSLLYGYRKKKIKIGCLFKWIATAAKNWIRTVKTAYVHMHMRTNGTYDIYIKKQMKKKKTDRFIKMITNKNRIIIYTYINIYLMIDSMCIKQASTQTHTGRVAVDCIVIKFGLVIGIKWTDESTYSELYNKLNYRSEFKDVKIYEQRSITMAD